MSGSAGSGRQETEEERLDRNLEELLGELRVILPGVQVLFAFLLVVPFNQRFEDVSTFQKYLYLATLLFAATASACLIAPSIHHRITFRTQDKEYLVARGQPADDRGWGVSRNRDDRGDLAHTGYLYGDAITAVAAAGVAVTFAILWYVVPLRRLRQQRNGS